MNSEANSTINLVEIEKQLKIRKSNLENEKNNVLNDLISLKKEEDIIDGNIAYFEMYLKKLENESNNNSEENEDKFIFEEKIDNNNYDPKHKIYSKTN